MLELTVFLSGAFVMVLEMVGARVLAPHVGTSAIVWTSLIGVVLACMALGAWAGGRFADKRLSARGLAEALLGASCGCALTAFCHHAIGAGVVDFVGNLYASAVLAALGIFALPAFFFGMITPYVIRLRIASVDTAGSTVGRLYALSTAGSILGTFLGGFILISFFSSSAILWGLALAMLLLSIANWRGRILGRIAVLVLFGLVAWQDHSWASWLAAQGGPMLVESPYSSIQITEGQDHRRGNAKVRLMSTNPGYVQSGMLIDDPEELYFDYTRYYALGGAYVPNARSVLMLGGGGYSVPKWLLSPKNGMLNRKNLKVDVVELDPMMTGLAAKIFNLPNDPRLSIFHEDARAFVNALDTQYDLVFVDVFNSHYSIPFQMATREAIREMRKAVAPGGALIMNVISAIDGEDGRFFRALLRGMKEQFAEVRVYCVGSPYDAISVQNIMVVGLPEADRQLRIGPLEEGHSPNSAEIANMLSHLYNDQVIEDEPVLTDDFAPVEKYALMLTRSRS